MVFSPKRGTKSGFRDFKRLNEGQNISRIPKQKSNSPVKGNVGNFGYVESFRSFATHGRDQYQGKNTKRGRGSVYAVRRPQYLDGRYRQAPRGLKEDFVSALCGQGR